MTNKIALLVAIVLGLVAALAAHSWIESEKQKQKAMFKTVGIVVAKRTLRKGDSIRLGAGVMVEKRIPEEMIVTGMISTSEIGRFRGYLLKDRVDIGQPILRDKLEPPYEKAQTDASVVEEGKRAVTVSVDIISGVAGLIRPGDRVDVAVTFDLAKRANAHSKIQRTTVTLYLLQNVRVIALDSRTERPSGRVKKIRNRAYRAVTLEVDPADAMRIINAQEQGRLRLMLRNRKDVALQPSERQGNPIGVNVIANELDNIAPHAR